MALSDFRVRWLAGQVDPRYITRPDAVRDPVFQFTIIDDDVTENFMEYFEIDLKLNPRGNGNGFFYPNAVGRVTIIDDDIRKLLMHYHTVCSIMLLMIDNNLPRCNYSNIASYSTTYYIRQIEPALCLD